MRAGAGNLGVTRPGQGQGCPGIDPPPSVLCPCSKTLQRNRKMAMGRKKFNMDPKKVLGATGLGSARQTSRRGILASLFRSVVVKGLP